MARQNKRDMLEDISRAVGIPPSDGFNGNNCVKRELVTALHQRIVENDGDDTTLEQYYIVRNDRPARALGVTEPVVICGEADSPDRQAVYDRSEKDRAFEERDKIRNEADNPYINVYKITVKPVDDPRGEGEQ